jgi:hypothetical protein
MAKQRSALAEPAAQTEAKTAEQETEAFSKRNPDLAAPAAISKGPKTQKRTVGTGKTTFSITRN